MSAKREHLSLHVQIMQLLALEAGGTPALPVKSLKG